MLNIAVCDDSTVQAENLGGMLKAVAGLDGARTDVYYSARGLLEALNIKRYDIILLDIVLGDDSGIETAKLVNIRAPRTQVIYMTGFLEYSAEICETDFAYFLSKPVTPEKLALSVRRAIANLKAAEETPVLISVQRDIVRLLPSEIVYCERMRRLTVVNCEKMSFETAMKLAELEELLPRGGFARPHNSYTVNLSKIRRLGKTDIDMVTGQTLPVSRRNCDEFRAAFFSAVGRRDIEP